MELNENYDAETWLAEWWPIVLANFRVIKNAYDAEMSARKAADNTLQANIAAEATARAEADDAIANGMRVINANLGSGTEMTSALIKNDWLRRDIWDIISRFANLRLITYKASELGYVGGVFVVPEESIYIIENDTAAAFSQFSATDETRYILSEPISAGGKRICIVMSDVITGADPEQGSLYVMDSDSMTVYEESLEELIGILDDIEELKASVPTSATAAEIREAWNPTPVTPTVTISGAYDADSETLVISAEDMAKLEALNVQELFDLVINATGVEYSGAAKTITTITTSLTQEAPIYEFRSSIPLWDTEYSYNRFNDCYIISHYDSPDAGEIVGGQW